MPLTEVSGLYVGNASGPRSIDCGFQPKLVFLMSSATGVTGEGAGGVIITPDGVNHLSAALFFADAALAANGFSINGVDSVNKNGANYYYTAFGGADLVTGTYVGDGLDNRQVTGVGFSPEAVIVIRSNNTPYGKRSEFKTKAHVSSATSYFFAGNNSSHIVALQADGFSLESATGATFDSNQSGLTYRYFAFKAGSVKAVGYAGNLTDNRNITGFTFTPTFAWFKRSTNVQGGVRAGAMTGDMTGLVNTNGGTAANLIQSFASDTVQIGDNSTINGGTQYLIATAGSVPTYPPRYAYALNSGLNSGGLQCY